MTLAHCFELWSSVLPICWETIIVNSTVSPGGYVEQQVSRIFIFAIFFIYLQITLQITVRWLLFFLNHSWINWSDTYIIFSHFISRELNLARHCKVALQFFDSDTIILATYYYYFQYEHHFEVENVSIGKGCPLALSQIHL